LILLIIFKTITSLNQFYGHLRTSPFCGRKVPQKRHTVARHRGKLSETAQSFLKFLGMSANFLLGGNINFGAFYFMVEQYLF